jgi:hypothetical protein
MCYRRAMRFLLPAALTTVLMMIGSAKAEDIQIIGAGAQSCGTWIADHRDGILAGDDQWILGFLSGAAYEGDGPNVLNPLRGVDAEAVWAWVSNYCRAHPLDRITDAGVAFIAAHPH